MEGLLLLGWRPRSHPFEIAQLQGLPARRAHPPAALRDLDVPRPNFLQAAGLTMNHETAVANAKELANRVLAPAARQNDKKPDFHRKRSRRLVQPGF